MSPVNDKRTTSSLSPSILYVAKNWKNLKDSDRLTGWFVILQCDDKLRPLLEAFEEVSDEVADVLGVRALEGELLRSDRAQRERLGEGFVTPETNKKHFFSQQSSKKNWFRENRRMKIECLKGLLRLSLKVERVSKILWRKYYKKISISLITRI